MNQTPVLIVGGGPVGLALALALARQNVHSTLFEAKPEIDPHSRALGIAPRTLEIFRSWDIGRKNGPRKLIPFILNANVSQKNPGWVRLSFELPAEFSSHSAVRAVTTDQIPSTVALCLSTAILDHDAGSFVVLLKALDSMSEQYLCITCSLHAFEQQPLSPILRQNQDAVSCSDFLKNA